MAKVEDTKKVKVVITRRVDHIEYENKGFKDFVKQAGIVMENGKPKMKNYTVILGAEVELPETIVEYIKNRKIPKASANKSDKLNFVNEFVVEKL